MIGSASSPLARECVYRLALLPSGLKRGPPSGRRRTRRGLHSLRHFYPSWCINRRVDGGLELPLKLVQARLGHASIQMTADTYGHLFPRSGDGAELAAAERAFMAG
jgi:integrase